MKSAQTRNPFLEKFKGVIKVADLVTQREDGRNSKGWLTVTVMVAAREQKRAPESNQGKKLSWQRQRRL